jgi:hypothetical protein
MYFLSPKEENGAFAAYIGRDLQLILFGPFATE